jgi:hypothetical protein
MGRTEPALCPSAPGEAGAKLIGTVGPDGRVRRLRTSLAVTEDFLAAAAQAGPVEARFRFSAPCAEAGCAQWGGGRCLLSATLIERAQARAVTLPDESGSCELRPTCRWWQQDGEAACRVCSFVVYRSAAPG